jgi:hypothetical protein
MKCINLQISGMLLMALMFGTSGLNAQKAGLKKSTSSEPFPEHVIRVEYFPDGKPASGKVEIPLSGVAISGNIRISSYLNESYEVVIHEIKRETFTEVNGEFRHLSDEPSCATLKLIFPSPGSKWKWFRGLDKSVDLGSGEPCLDTIGVKTLLPPDGAFNGKTLSDGGYGDPVGKGTMSFYPLCAIGIDERGTGLGVDMALPVVYRLGADPSIGLFAEFDFATSPLTTKFPNRAFFKLCRFDFNPQWGMRAALKKYYSIFPEAFKKRVVNEGIWLPFTSLRSIPGWDEFGIAFHETSWGSKDLKSGEKIPNILSDKGTGVLSFQYTEPWDVQLPVKIKTMGYAELVSGGLITKEHRSYLDISATRDKNGLWQARRLETPWFTTGWAVSITTNCDPDLPGFSKYKNILKDEINPALSMDADGIYFDSMEWNWHHDLNYREDHFAFTDYPLTFSLSVGKPAIWNFSSEFEFMKKISDEMHIQGKLSMGNGHGWNPFAASNLDLFGAELSWYSSDDHNTEALDFKRAISFQKPIVFLLNEGLNDKAFTEAPYAGYEIYFEKMLAYGFFPSFFSVNASSDPYWRDMRKIGNGRPFFKKYIPVIKMISAAGWEPVTFAWINSEKVRVERFGNGGNLFFTIRNSGDRDQSCILTLDLKGLDIAGNLAASELLTGEKIKVKESKIPIRIPAGRTRVIRVISAQPN